MPLEIQIISDTHIEFQEHKKRPAAINFIKPSANILALLGDICCCASDEDFTLYKKFINELLPLYEHILIITGNHEYFNNNKQITDLKQVDKKIKSFCKTSTKLHFLNNKSINFKVNNQIYHIIGTTLWSNIPEAQYKHVQKNMNDYKFIYIKDKTSTIRKILPYDTSKKFRKNVKFISNEIKQADPKHKIIVLSHHKPYTSQKYDVSSLDVAYESDLTKLFENKVALWAYGHTHKYDKRLIGSTLLYSNPRGYPGQKTGYLPSDVITIS